MSKKDDRRFEAQAHIAEMNRNYRREIADSVAGTKLYAPGKALTLDLTPPHGDGKPAVKVKATDTVSAILDSAGHGKVAALDFASYRHPGGGYSNGAMAQEEALCSESNLYNILNEHWGRFYNPNKNSLNDSLYTSKAMYVPGVIFQRGRAKSVADVIVCAAPNVGAAKKARVPEEECRQALAERIETVMAIAADQQVDCLILGAFGCGVFKNDPEQVARMFLKWLDAHPGHFREVIFAVMKGGSNLGVFKETYGKWADGEL